MELKIDRCLYILGDYDNTVERARSVAEIIERDTTCDEDTKNTAENLLIAVLLDKSEHFLPKEEQEQSEMLNQATGLQDVVDALPDPTPLIFHAVIGLAIAMSQSHYGFEPWNRVREALLEKEE